MFACNIRPNI